MIAVVSSVLCMGIFVRFFCRLEVVYVLTFLLEKCVDDVGCVEISLTLFLAVLLLRLSCIDDSF